MAKTYLPTLRKILERVCFYITRYGDVLAVYLTPTQFTLLQAVQTACSAFMESLDPEVINP
jgi:hypothetical protein